MLAVTLAANQKKAGEARLEHRADEGLLDVEASLGLLETLPAGDDPLVVVPAAP